MLPIVFYGFTFMRYMMIEHSITNLPQPPLAFAPFHFNLGAAWTDIAEWHRQTWLYHINLKADHIFYSPWWTWPLDFRPVVYYFTNTGLGVDQSTGSALVAEIFNLGNPLSWWGGTFALVGIAIGLPWLIRDYRSRRAMDGIEREGRDLAGTVDQRLHTSIFLLTAFSITCSAGCRPCCWRWRWD